RRQFLHLAASAAALPAASRVASAQLYPTRPVRLVVGAPAGGGFDIVARLIGQWLSERLGQAAWRARQIMPGQRTQRAVGQHIARFVLVGLYSGSRSGAICGAALMPTIGRGHVDLERGVFYRRAKGGQETKKRQPPVRLPDRLLAHLRRWQRLGI